MAEKIKTKNLKELWLPTTKELSNWGFDCREKLEGLIDIAAREGMEVLLHNAKGTIHVWDDGLVYCLFDEYDSDLILSDNLQKLITKDIHDQDEKRMVIYHLEKMLEEVKAFEPKY